MQPHFMSRVDPGTLELFKAVRSYVEQIPERIEGIGGELVKVTSHNLVQAIAHELRTLKPVHGYFDSSNEHAWLLTPQPFYIIDPAPPFVFGGPILIYTSGYSSGFSPWSRIYDSERRPTALDKLGLLEEVNAIVQAVDRIRMYNGIP